MTAHEKQCADCGASFTSRQPNARYCYLCRLDRNLMFIGERTSECWRCAKRFAPLSRNDRFCGHCYRTGTAHSVEGTCVLCHKESPNLLHADVSVCGPCATDPDNRRVLLRAVAKKRDTLVASMQTTTEED
jgi:hypothetical protein